MKALFKSDFKSVTRENKMMQQKLCIIQFISQSDNGCTVPDICKELKITAPTGIKLVNAMQEEGILTITGKKETANGRRPYIYTLSNRNFYALCAEVLQKRISVGIIDSRLNAIYYRQKTDFVLENTKECLKKVEDYMLFCMENSGINSDSILGLGIGITGNVKNSTGKFNTYFNFMDVSLENYFYKIFDIPVFVNNDARCLGLTERIIGKAKNFHNVIVIKLSRNLGSALIIDNKIVKGTMGYAGELGHMQFDHNDNTPCICGNNGCLDTQVGGGALEKLFSQRLAAGEKSMLTMTQNEEIIHYDHILAASLEKDPLSLSLVKEMGLKLGFALGNIINLINPEKIIIGGKFAKLEEVIRIPLEKGLNESALKNPMKQCSIEFSELGELGGLKGAGAMVFENFKLIKK